MRAAALAAALAVLLCCTGATAARAAASPTAVQDMLRLMTTCGTQISTLKGLGAGCLVRRMMRVLLPLAPLPLRPLTSPHLCAPPPAQLQVSTAGEHCPRVCRALTALSQRAPDPRGCVAAMLSTPAPASASARARPAAEIVSKYTTVRRALIARLRRRPSCRDAHPDLCAPLSQLCGTKAAGR